MGNPQPKGFLASCAKLDSMGDTTDRMWAIAVGGVAKGEVGDQRIQKILKQAEKLSMKSDKTEAEDPHLVDLTAITRTKRGIQTYVYVEDHEACRMKLWVKAGECELVRSSSSDRPWMFGMRMDATDFEHDTAWAFRIDLVGVSLSDVMYGATTVDAYVCANPRGFNAPRPGYNPLAAAVRCKQCKGKDGHLIVPEGNYVPAYDEEMFRRYAGVHLRITTGYKPEG